MSEKISNAVVILPPVSIRQSTYATNNLKREIMIYFSTT